MRVMESGWPLIGKLCLVPVCVEERCAFSLQFPEASFSFFSCHPNIRHMECSTWLIPPQPQNLVNEKALLLTPVPVHPKEMVLFPLHHLYLPFCHWDWDREVATSIMVMECLTWTQRGAVTGHGPRLKYSV